MPRTISYDAPCTLEEARSAFGPPWYTGQAELGWFMPLEPERNGAGRTRDGCTFKGGRVTLHWRGMDIPAARMVWFIHTGVWPKGRMGIRNHNQADIRFANLYVIGEPDVSDLV